MAKKTNENLIPQNKRTKAEQREIARQGGIASGKARREKKQVRDFINAWLDEEHTDKSGNVLTGAEMIASKIVQMSIKDGNMKSMEMLLALAGQKPAEKVIVSDIDNDVINEVERMVESGQKTSD